MNRSLLRVCRYAHAIFGFVVLVVYSLGFPVVIAILLRRRNYEVSACKCPVVECCLGLETGRGYRKLFTLNWVVNGCRMWLMAICSVDSGGPYCNCRAWTTTGTRLIELLMSLSLERKANGPDVCTC